MSKYRMLMNVNRDNKPYKAGDVVELDLTPKEEKELILMKAIEKVDKMVPAKEVKKGTTEQGGGENPKPGESYVVSEKREEGVLLENGSVVKPGEIITEDMKPVKSIKQMAGWGWIEPVSEDATPEDK